MSGYLTPDGVKYLLNVLVGGSASSRTVYLGFAYDVNQQPNTTLATISEVSTTGTGYGRVAIAWNPAAVVGDPNVVPASVSNSTQTDVGPFTSEVDSISYAFLTDTQTGTTIAAPAGLTLGTTATGGTFAAGTYYWQVTAVNSHGETTISNEVTKALTLNQQQPLTWTTVSGATSYNVYRGTSSGGENVLVGSSATGSFTDTGAVGTSQLPPTVNGAANGNILYVWELASSMTVLSGEPIRTVAGQLVIQ